MKASLEQSSAYGGRNGAGTRLGLGSGERVGPPPSRIRLLTLATEMIRISVVVGLGNIAVWSNVS